MNQPANEEQAFDPDLIAQWIAARIEGLTDDQLLQVYYRLPAVEHAEADHQRAIAKLAKSVRGTSALAYLLDWLDDDGIGLDHHNQEAVLDLLRAAWARPGSTRDDMRTALEEKGWR